jgi:hypothetical protein
VPNVLLEIVAKVALTDVDVVQGVVGLHLTDEVDDEVVAILLGVSVDQIASLVDIHFILSFKREI